MDPAAPIAAVTGWLGTYKIYFETAAYLVGIIGIPAAYAQLRDSRRQRGLAEVFDLSIKLQASLKSFSEEANKAARDEFAFTHAFADVLIMYELISDGINRGYLTAIADKTLTRQMFDNLPGLLSWQGAADAYRQLCADEAVCAQVKILLLRRYQGFRASDPQFVALDVLFGVDNRWLVKPGLRRALLRALRIRKLKAIS